MMVAGIKNILFKNFGMDRDIIDYEAEIDKELTYEENYNIIFNKFVKPTFKEMNLNV